MTDRQADDIPGSHVTGSDATSPGTTGDGSRYLSLLLVAPVVYQFLVTVSGGRLVLGWQPGTLALVILTAAAVATWLPYRPSQSWPWPARAWLILLVALWLYVAVSAAVVDGDAHIAVVIVPLTAVLVYLRRPTREGALTATDALGCALVVAGLTTLLLEVVGAMPSWYESQGGAFLDLDEYDRANHWLLLGGFLGLDGRWGGPFGDPNIVGPAASMLVVYGFRRPGWRRWVLTLAGLLFVVLADSRASYAALVAGLGLLAVLPGWGARWLAWPRILALGTAALAALRLAADFSTNPTGSLTMTGRTEMWPDFLSLLDRSPLTGVGSDAILQAMADGLLPSWSNHGHNLFVDTVVRYGWIGLVLTAIVLGGVALRGLVAAWNREGLPLAMTATFVIVSVANVLIDWRYPGVMMSFLLATALLAFETPSRPRRA